MGNSRCKGPGARLAWHVLGLSGRGLSVAEVRVRAQMAWAFPLRKGSAAGVGLSPLAARGAEAGAGCVNSPVEREGQFRAEGGCRGRGRGFFGDQVWGGGEGRAGETPLVLGF